MTNLGSGVYSYFWVASGFLTVVVPLVFRNMRVRDFRELNMMYNWDQEWQQQQQGQYDYANSANWNGGQYYANQYESMRQNYDINGCRWWQLNCYPYYINADGDAQPEAGWFPSWYSGWAKTEEEREELRDAGLTSAAMRFVYVWQILTFAVILAYGFVVLKQKRFVTGLLIALVVFANMCFLAMWWLADGSIVIDSDYVQATGFYGQFAVLVFITNASYVFFGLVHSGILVWHGHSMQEEAERAGEQHQPEPTTSHTPNYWHMDTPSTKVSPNESGWTVVE